MGWKNQFAYPGDRNTPKDLKLVADYDNDLVVASHWSPRNE
jgi:hypothetical protein